MPARRGHRRTGDHTTARPAAFGDANESPEQNRPSDIQRRLERLIQQQRDTLRETERLQREIERSR